MKTLMLKIPVPRRTHLAFCAQKLIQNAAFAVALAALTLFSGCVSKVKDGSVAAIPIPQGVSKPEAVFLVAASLTAPGHAVYEQTIAAAAVPRELAATLKAYNDGKDSGNVRLVNDSTINVQRNLHYFRPPLTHAIDPALWDYVIEGNSVKHRFKFTVDSKRVRAFIDSLDSQIRTNFALLEMAKGGTPIGATMAAPVAIATYAPVSAPAPVTSALRAPSGNGLYLAYNPATPDSVVADAIRSAATARRWQVVSATPGSMRLEYKSYTINVSYGSGAILIDHNRKTEGWAKGLQSLIKRKLPA